MATVARHSLEQFGALILVADAAEAARAGRRDRPRAFAHRLPGCRRAGWPRFRHAGAVFLGNYSPVAVGDYVAGPSHVLPTGGTARFASGLSANDFLRAGSVIHYTREALEGVADDIRHIGRQRRAGGPPGQRRHPATKIDPIERRSELPHASTQQIAVSRPS